jgi:hypothetical protein
MSQKCLKIGGVNVYFFKKVPILGGVQVFLVSKVHDLGGVSRTIFQILGGVTIDMAIFRGGPKRFRQN